MNLPGHDKRLMPPEREPAHEHDCTLTGTTTLEHLTQAITSMPRSILNGEYASTKYNVWRETEYDAIGWLLHCAGIDDKTLINMDGYISDPHNSEYVWVLVRTYGLTTFEARYIEETADHKSRDCLDELLQVILRQKENVEKERVSA